MCTALRIPVFAGTTWNVQKLCFFPTVTTLQYSLILGQGFAIHVVIMINTDYCRVDQLHEDTDSCIFAFCSKFIFQLEYYKLLQQSRSVLSLVLTVGFPVYSFHNLFSNFHICAVNYIENINGHLSWSREVALFLSSFV